MKRGLLLLLTFLVIGAVAYHFTEIRRMRADLAHVRKLVMERERTTLRQEADAARARIGEPLLRRSDRDILEELEQDVDRMRRAIQELSKVEAANARLRDDVRGLALNLRAICLHLGIAYHDP